MHTQRGFIPRVLPHQSDSHRTTRPLPNFHIAATPLLEMMTLATLIFAPVALAATLTDNQHRGNASADMASSITEAATITNSTGACGVGYTYCGYILKEQKSTSCPNTSHPPVPRHPAKLLTRAFRL